MASREASPASLRQLIEGAQKLGLCPNRIWQSGARLADWRTALGEYLPDFCRTLPSSSMAHEDHLRCTLDTCEFSSRNFTAVLQYHEPYPYETGSQTATDRNHADPGVCFAVRGLFDDDTLVKAVKAGENTAWTFGGLATLDRSRPYMAISHVWSDGTGLGPWPSKQVPSCLYEYFCNMAESFGCEGLWWDALCVPQDPEVRGEALRTMDQNYARARVTLVHDRFLRGLPFEGPDKACFALVMSTWFTRGWTALELARSRRVRIIFADAVCDLDHDILGRAAHHNAAAKIIRHLRSVFDGRHAISLDELLSTLAPRFTSWPKDRAVIAGLLASIPMVPNQDGELWQRDIYQGIVRSIGKVSHGHLFHRSATMSDGFAWCPMDLFELPQSSPSPALSVTKSGALHGLWEVVALDDEQVRGELSEKAVWEIRHPLLEDTFRQVISTDWKNHVLLLDPEQVTKYVPGGGSNVRNAVIARVVEGTAEEPDLLNCQYVGSLDFHSAISVKKSIARNVVVGGTGGWAELGHRNDLETQLGPSDTQSLAASEGSQQYSQKQLVLHLAGENGDIQMVESVLSRSDAPTKELTRCDNDGQTPLHRAAWGGCVDIVFLMVSYGSIINAQDRDGRTALHLAAEQGFEQVVTCLCRQATTLGVDLVNVNTKAGLTALHYATLNGHHEVVKFILSSTEAAIDAAENIFRWMPLHLAADTGHAPNFQLLMDAGANLGQIDAVGWTALHLAAISGHVSITQLLLQRGPRELISREDSQGWMPIHFAVINGHRGVVDELLKVSDESWDLAMPLALFSLSTGKQTLGPSDFTRVVRWQGTAAFLEPSRSQNNDRRAWTRMHLAAIDGRPCVTRRLLRVTFRRDRPPPHGALPPLVIINWAAHDNDLGTMSLLVQLGADLNAQTETKLAPIWFTRNTLMLRLLLENGTNGQAMNREGRTLLTRAVKYGEEEFVENLLSTGKVDPDAPDDCELLTPLALAAGLGREGIVRRLLATGRVNLVPTAQEHLGKRAPLYYAVCGDHTAIARLIIEAGGGPGAKTKPEPNYPSPLMLAVESANIEMVRLLLDQGAGWSQFELGERKALSYAAELGHEEIVKELLRREHPGLHHRNNEFLGWTALFYAVKSGHENVVQLLLESAGQPDIRTQDRWERTPLYYAAMHGFEGIVKLLLGASDSSNIQVISKDYFGHQPRWYAGKSGYPAVVQILDSMCEDSHDRENPRGRFSILGRKYHWRSKSQQDSPLGPSSYLTDNFVPYDSI